MNTTITRRALLASGAAGLAGLAGAGGATAYVLHRFNRVGDYRTEALAALAAPGSSALLRRFPALRGRLPWRPLGRLPTPVEAWPLPGGGTLHIKRDDLSAGLYGGNKVRKLEHLLAEADLAGARQIITLGGIGSNQGLATALHGGQLGFEITLSLFDHPLSPAVHRNLRGDLAAGAQLRFAEGIAGSLLNARSAWLAAESPYFIPPGGSNRLGNVGFVNAGLELAEQIRAGQLPEPDRIYLPAGTCGTAAGLLAGLRLAGLRSRVIAVRVADPLFTNRLVLRTLARDVLRYLAELLPELPRPKVDDADFELLEDYLGPEYAAPTPAAVAARDWAAPRLTLETTYTGKALAACLDDVRTAGRGDKVLFWNTYNSRDFPLAGSLHGLPPALQARLQEQARYTGHDTSPASSTQAS